MIMDEPTNAMDNRSEELIKKRFQIALKDKTVLLVTHKGSLLSLVDRIILIDSGKVLADGPKEQVLKALSDGQLRTGRM